MVTTNYENRLTLKINVHIRDVGTGAGAVAAQCSTSDFKSWRFKKAVVKNISFVYPKKATKKVEFGLRNGHFRRYLDTLNVQNFEHANHAGAS